MLNIPPRNFTKVCYTPWDFYTKKELTTGNSAVSFLDHHWRFHTFSNKPLEILHPITPQLLPRNYLSSTFPVDFFSGTANMVVSAT